MRFFQFTLLAFIIFVFFLSCSTQNKLPKDYLQDVSDTIEKDAIKYKEPRIKKNDLLSIQVYSMSTEPEVDLPYNLPNLGGTTQTGKTISGFLVDQNGNIEYPRIGTVQVEGLTKQELADIIKTKLTGQLEQPTVIVRFLNFKVTVIGEVLRPGSYDIPTEKVTILEAIGLAGDIPVTGKKTNVRVIRENNGNREIGTIDLTSKGLFESPFYNLQQNDVIKVEPTKSKVKQQADQLTTQRISIALSIITSIALIYNVFR